MPVETWLIFILLFMILGSIAALEMKDVLSAIVSVGIVGLGLSVCFLFLQAPDLAVVQFLFEIFALVILVRAFLGKEYHFEEPSKSNFAISIITMITLGAVLIYSMPVFNLIPKFGYPLMTTAQYYLDNGAAQSGAANLVSPIVLDYRGYDTLGEVTILFVAIVGAISVLRIKEKAEDKEIKRPATHGMTLIVKTITRISVWLIMLYGIYIIMHGHLTPGGGFGGGVIIALALLNVMLAYGRDFTAKWLNLNFLRDIEAASAVLYLALGLLGISFGGAFLMNFISKGKLFALISSGTILPLNIIIGIKVSMSLFLVVWALAGFKIEKGAK